MLSDASEAFTLAASRIIRGFASFLPGLLALLVAILAALIVAFIVQAAIRQSLRRLDFDGLMEQWGFSSVAEWSPGRSPSRLIASVVFWLIVLFGLLLGLTALDATMPSALILQLFAYLPNVLVAVLILVAGTVLARFLARGVLISAVNMQIHSARLLSLGVKWMVMVIAAAMALQHLGIGGNIVQLAFAILFGGIVLALALAVGLGSKDIVSRSLQRQNDRADEQPEETFHHI